MTQTHKKIIAISGVVLFLLLSGLIGWFVGRPMIAYLSEPEQFRQWVDDRGIWGPLVFLGMMILQIFVAVIPGEPLEIVAGYAFGAVEGTILCVLGSALGGALVFGFVRRFGVKAVEVFFSREQIENLRFLRNKRRVKLFFLLAFILPGTPKDILSYFAGLTRMPFRTWMLLTSLCRLPSIVTSTMGGDALGTGAWLTAGLIFGITVCISLLGMAIYRHLCRKRQTHDKKDAA